MSNPDDPLENPAADPVAELRSRAETLERQLTELQRQTEGRLIQAELKAEAVRAGIVDLDGLRLIDASALKLNERGELDGGAALMQALKKNKPWLFAGPITSSSSPSATPQALPAKQKLATEMTDAEYRLARAAIVKRRG